MSATWRLAGGAWARLGFEVRPGGRHTAFGSENVLLPLADGSYIELLAFTDPQKAAARRGWAELVDVLDRGGGLGAFALLCDDLEGDVSRLRDQGVLVDGPFDGSRTTPAGELVAWRSAFVGAASEMTVYPFLIQDQTPRPLRIAPPASGLGRRLSTAGLIIVAPDPQPLQHTYQIITGVAPEHRADAGLSAHAVRFAAAWGFVDLVGPDGSGSHASAYLMQRGSGTYAIVLRADDLDAVAAQLGDAGTVPLAGTLGGVECAWLEPQTPAGARIAII